MKRIGVVLGALFGRKMWWVTLVVIAGTLLLARLGFWQLDRLEQRRSMNTALALALDAAPLQLTGDPLPNELAPLRNRRVVARGEFDTARQVVLKVQNLHGRAGVHLLTPLLIEGSETAVLVDRGWIPVAEATTARLSQFDQPGLETVEGRIALSQKLSHAPSASLPSEPQEEWYRVDIEAIQAQLPYGLLPIYIVRAPEAGVAENFDLPIRVEPEIDLSEGSHFGYAIQWFIFSLMLAVGYVAYVDRYVVAPRAMPENKE